MSNTFSSKITPTRLVIVSFIILVFTAILGWYRLVLTSPAGVFNRMLFNTLSTPGAYKASSQSESDQSLDQKTQILTSPQQAIHSVDVLRQGAQGDNVITTESIGTTDTDYVRYIDIKTNQKTAEGKNFDFKSVVGVWGKNSAENASGGGAQLFNQAVLGVVPVGNITANQRQQLLNQIKNDHVYTVDFKKAVKSKSEQTGRVMYTYNVVVKPVAYVSMLKTFALDIGLKQLEAVDPNRYANSAPLNFTVDIDILSGELTKIDYKDSKRTEVYGSYGVLTQITTPEKTIPVEELQSRLQQIQ